MKTTKQSLLRRSTNTSIRQEAMIKIDENNEAKPPARKNEDTKGKEVMKIN